MRRRDQPAAACNEANIGLRWHEALGAVQKQERSSAAALEKLNLYAGERYRLARHGHGWTGQCIPPLLAIRVRFRIETGFNDFLILAAPAAAAVIETSTLASPSRWKQHARATGCYAPPEGRQKKHGMRLWSHRTPIIACSYTRGRR